MQSAYFAHLFRWLAPADPGEAPASIDLEAASSRKDEGSRSSSLNARNLGRAGFLSARNNRPLAAAAPRLQVQTRNRRKMVDVTGIEPVTPCLQSRCSAS